MAFLLNVSVSVSVSARVENFAQKEETDFEVNMAGELDSDTHRDLGPWSRWNTKKARTRKTIAGAVGLEDTENTRTRSVGLEDTENTSTRAEAREAEVADIGGGNQIYRPQSLRQVTCINCNSYSISFTR